MKGFGIILILIPVLGFNILGQADNRDSQTLNQQIIAFYQQGKLDDAIPLAKQVVDNEKKAAPNSETHALSLMNLAVLHKERLRQQMKVRDNGTSKDVQKLVEGIDKDAREAESIFRESLKIVESGAQRDSRIAASIKNELAWVLHNYIAARTEVYARARIDEAEKLLTEALVLQEKHTGANSDTVLKSILSLGDFYMRWINFERALPYYERYISEIEKKNGKTARALVPALRAFVEVMVITLREKQAHEIADRISGITGKPEPLPVTNPRLSLRGRKLEKVKLDSFAPPEFVSDARNLFGYSVAANMMSQMGRVKVKYIAVNIIVDEEGNVIEAKVADKNTKNIKEIEEAAQNSKFRPFVYEGIAQKMRGSMLYPYLEN